MRIAIVGGGIGGLAAARALVAAGHDAHVLEAADAVGGVLGTSRVDGFVREHAASSFLGGPPRGARALCHELGVHVEKASPRAKRRWIYIDGKLRALPSNPVELVRSDLLTWRGKLALLREPFAPQHAAGDDESVHAFAARRLGPEAARAIVAPFVTGVFAADAHDISLAAGFPRLAALDARGGIVRGTLGQAARGIAGKLLRRVGSSGSAGSGANGLSPKRVARERGMFAPIGGLGALIDALAVSLGERVVTGRRVHAIAGDARGVTIDGERWDGCVLAVPATIAAELVGGQLAAKLATLERAPVAIVFLGIADGAVPSARDGFGFLVALGEDLRVLGVVFESTVWPDRAPDGKTLLRCIFGGSRDPGAFALSDAELIDRATRDVARAFGGGELAPSHASVVRWPRGIAQYRIGHHERVRAAVAAARSLRIALAGADYRGAGINDLCADADTIVAEVGTWS